VRALAGVGAIALAGACVPDRQVVGEGPVALEGTTRLEFDPPLRTPGLFHDLCLALPEGYDVDLESQQLVAPSGERGAVSARLRIEAGRWFDFASLSRARPAKGSDYLCLASELVQGRQEMRFVEGEIRSELPWQSPEVVWQSREYL
jgi:hypothetical protein